MTRQTTRLDATCFGKSAPKPTINLDGICTTTAKASYYSPKVDSISTPTADLAVISDAVTFKTIDQLGDTFMGGLLHMFPTTCSSVG